MEGAMTNLRGIHVLSVMQYEEEMSRFRLGLSNLRAADFKWIPSCSTFALAHFMSSPRKEEMESGGGGPSSICVSCLSLSVMQIE